MTESEVSSMGLSTITSTPGAIDVCTLSSLVEVVAEIESEISPTLITEVVGAIESATRDGVTIDAFITESVSAIGEGGTNRLSSWGVTGVWGVGADVGNFQSRKLALGFFGRTGPMEGEGGNGIEQGSAIASVTGRSEITGAGERGRGT
jgi:hypothetical protein